MADGDLILSDYVHDMAWQLQEMQAAPMFNSGFSQVTSMVEPHWRFDLETRWLDRDSYQLWDSWLVDRRGAASTFLGWRMSRPNAKVAVGSDTGLTLTAWDRTASTLSFGSTGTWTATKGDMLSYYTKKLGYWCGMAMETKSAAANVMSALKVYPPPFEPHASTPAPRRIRALAEFRLILPIPKPVERVDERRISFSAMQVIRG